MRPLVVVLTLTFVALALACAPPVYWKEPVGVSDKAEVASDQSLDMDGGDDYACVHQSNLVEGKPCAPEGKTCGEQNAESILVCRHGAWDREEVVPPTSTSAKPATAKPANP